MKYRISIIRLRADCIGNLLLVVGPPYHSLAQNPKHAIKKSLFKDYFYKIHVHQMPHFICNMSAVVTCMLWFDNNDEIEMTNFHPSIALRDTIKGTIWEMPKTAELMLNRLNTVWVGNLTFRWHIVLVSLNMKWKNCASYICICFRILLKMSNKQARKPQRSAILKPDSTGCL